jgi:hypothetical protein
MDRFERRLKASALCAPPITSWVIHTTARLRRRNQANLVEGMAAGERHDKAPSLAFHQTTCAAGAVVVVVDAEPYIQKVAMLLLGFLLGDGSRGGGGGGYVFFVVGASGCGKNWRREPDTVVENSVRNLLLLLLLLRLNYRRREHALGAI